VDAAAKMTSKGQVTVPKVVRDALGIGAGDEVVVLVEGHRAVLARTPNFLDLAGTINVPAAKRNVTSGFAEKKPVFQAAPYSLTKQVSDAPEWTAKTIEARQALLAKLAVQTWPIK